MPFASGRNPIAWQLPNPIPMKIPTTILLALFSLELFNISVEADVVTDWNFAALDAIRPERTPPPMAARNPAILHISIFDACDGIVQNFQPYFVTNKVAGVTSKIAALAAAAHEALGNLYPDPGQRTNFDAAYRHQLAAIPDGERKSTGITRGESVADAIILYGGIHFWSADLHGRFGGAPLGGYVSENFLLPRPGNSHRGR